VERVGKMNLKRADGRKKNFGRMESVHEKNGAETKPLRNIKADGTVSPPTGIQVFVQNQKGGGKQSWSAVELSGQNRGNLAVHQG